ncbi:MAG: hypothetical protein WBJ51_02205 [Methanoculleus sp.]
MPPYLCPTGGCRTPKSHGHLTGLPEFIAAACRIALPAAGRR